MRRDRAADAPAELIPLPFDSPAVITAFGLLGDKFVFLVNGTDGLELARVDNDGTETRLRLELPDAPIYDAQIIETSGQTIYLKYGSDIASFFAEMTCSP
jgi:hypothetical protein